MEQNGICVHPTPELAFADEYGVSHFWCGTCQSLYQVAVVVDPKMIEAALVRMDPALLVGLLSRHPGCLELVEELLARMNVEDAKDIVLRAFPRLFPDVVDPNAAVSDPG